MTFLCDFPQDLTVSILANWCNIKDIAWTDSAICNDLERNILISCYQSNGFIINDDLQIYCYNDYEEFKHSDYDSSTHSHLKLHVIQWIHFKQINLSIVIFDISYRGIPFCRTTTEALLKLNTNTILSITFSVSPRNRYFLDFKNRKHFLNGTVQFINKCHQLKELCFHYEHYNNQLIVELNPVILKQLERFGCSSFTKLYKQKLTTPFLIKHCVSLTVLQLYYKENSIETEHVSELMLIKLVMNNKKLNEIHLINVNATDSLLDAIFCNCVLIHTLFMFTKKFEKSEKEKLSLHCISKYVCKTLRSHHIITTINGTDFGMYQSQPLSKDRYNFRFKGKVSEKVFHDLVLLAQTPVLKHTQISDNLLYYEDEFVLVENKTV
jgi:hypothetical protein